MSTNLFLGGIPTKPDVDKLRKQYGEPPEGTVVLWDHIADLIGQKKGTHRFNAVVTSWRKVLESESNIVMGAERGVGLRVLTPDERIERSAVFYKQGCRKIARASRLAEKTDPNRLTSGNAAIQKKLVDTAGIIRTAVATAAKEIRWPDPVKKPK